MPMTHDDNDLDMLRASLKKTARSRLSLELAGLAFALQKGASPEEYARHLWSSGAAGWIKKDRPGAGEYLEKEAEALRYFYPEVGFSLIETGENKAELAFTEGCLGSTEKDRWRVAKRFGLNKTDVCRYCAEAFRLWAGQLGLVADIAPRPGNTCTLRVTKP